MKVKDLIQKLLHFNPEMEAMFWDEYNYREVESVEIVELEVSGVPTGEIAVGIH